MDPGQLDLAKHVAAPDRDRRFLGPPGQARFEGALRVAQAASEPFHGGQVAPRPPLLEHPLVLTQVGQGPRRKGGRGVGVPSQDGEVAAMDRDGAMASNGHVVVTDGADQLPAGRLLGELFA